MAEFEALGIGVVGVAMSQPVALRSYLASRPLPFPLFADPQRTAYAAFALGRTSWLRFARPGVIWRYLRLIFRGWWVRGVAKDEDPLQTGGDFLFDRERRLIWEHRTDDPTDRPNVDELLRVIREQIVDARPASA